MRRAIRAAPSSCRSLQEHPAHGLATVPWGSLSPTSPTPSCVPCIPAQPATRRHLPICRSVSLLLQLYAASNQQPHCLAARGNDGCGLPACMWPAQGLTRSHPAPELRHSVTASQQHSVTRSSARLLPDHTSDSKPLLLYSAATQHTTGQRQAVANCTSPAVGLSTAVTSPDTLPSLLHKLPAQACALQRAGMQHASSCTAAAYRRASWAAAAPVAGTCSAAPTSFM